MSWVCKKCGAEIRPDPGKACTKPRYVCDDCKRKLRAANERRRYKASVVTRSKAKGRAAMARHRRKAAQLPDWA